MPDPHYDNKSESLLSSLHRFIGKHGASPLKIAAKYNSHHPQVARKAEISKDVSAFFAPDFFRIFIDPFSMKPFTRQWKCVMFAEVKASILQINFQKIAVL